MGDYLAGPEGVVFIAEIEPPKPMLVVMTNTVVNIAKPGAPALAGLNQYGAVLPGTQTVLISDFPASLLVGGIGDRTKAGLPDDTKVPGFSALLPVVEGVEPHVADILTNNRSEHFIVTAVEQFGGVWRLSLVQAVS